MNDNYQSNKQISNMKFYLFVGVSEEFLNTIIEYKEYFYNLLVNGKRNLYLPSFTSSAITN